MDRRRLIRLTLLVAGACAFWFGVFVYFIPTSPPYPPGKLEDMNSLRNMLGLLTEREAFPFDADGRVAAYAAVEPHELEEFLDVFQSVQRKTGPTLTEARAHDYRNFPWVRYKRVDGKEPKPGEGRVPILWAPQPDEEGLRVVGFSNGAVKWIEEPDVAALLERHGQQ
ncbi:MAG: hypothetical protein ACYTGN_00595 [Planctomycetota bacterium]